MNSKLLHIFIEKEFHSVSLFDRFTESEKNILATAHFFVFFLADGTPTVYIINKKKHNYSLHKTSLLPFTC